MIEVNLKCESDVRPEKFSVENIFGTNCDIVLNDNIEEHTREDEEGNTQTYYTYDIYRIVKGNYRNDLEADLSKTATFNQWLRFAKEQYANQPIVVSEDERISAVEQAITDIGEIIGEVIGNG